MKEAEARRDKDLLTSWQREMELPGAISNLKQKIQKLQNSKNVESCIFVLVLSLTQAAPTTQNLKKLFLMNFVLEILKSYSFYVKIFFEFGFRNSRKLIFQFCFMNLKDFFLFIKTFLYQRL